MDSQNIWCTISINTQKKGGARYIWSKFNRYLWYLGDNWLFTCLLVHGYRGSRCSSWCRFECFENLRRIRWWRSTEAYSRRTQVWIYHAKNHKSTFIFRHSYFIITRPPDNPQPPPYVLCEWFFFLFCILVIMFPKNESFKFFSSYSDSIFKNCK